MAVAEVKTEDLWSSFAAVSVVAGLIGSGTDQVVKMFRWIEITRPRTAGGCTVSVLVRSIVRYHTEICVELPIAFPDKSCMLVLINSSFLLTDSQVSSGHPALNRPRNEIHPSQEIDNK